MSMLSTQIVDLIRNFTTEVNSQLLLFIMITNPFVGTKQLSKRSQCVDNQVPHWNLNNNFYIYFSVIVQKLCLQKNRC